MDVHHIWTYVALGLGGCCIVSIFVVATCWCLYYCCYKKYNKHGSSPYSIANPLFEEYHTSAVCEHCLNTGTIEEYGDLIECPHCTQET